MTWLHIVARTKSIPKDFVCSDNCEQHALYGRMFNAHPLEKSSRELSGPSQPLNNYPSFLETLEELSSEDDSSDTDVTCDEDEKADLVCNGADQSAQTDANIPIIKITMPKTDGINLEDVDWNCCCLLYRQKAGLILFYNCMFTTTFLQNHLRSSAVLHNCSITNLRSWRLWRNWVAKITLSTLRSTFIMTNAIRRQIMFAKMLTNLPSLMLISQSLKWQCQRQMQLTWRIWMEKLLD